MDGKISIASKRKIEDTPESKSERISEILNKKIKMEIENPKAECLYTKDEVNSEIENNKPCSPVEVLTPNLTENLDPATFDLSSDDPRYPQFVLDCEELKESFNTGNVDEVSTAVAERMYKIYLPYLEAVHNRKVNSDIYIRFSQDVDEGYKMNYTDGCIVLSYQNLMYFTRVIGKHFSANENDNIKKLNYFLKVLVPELIIKIMMGIYKIHKPEALVKMIEITAKVAEKYDDDVFF